jgi:hypothetical protein
VEDGSNSTSSFHIPKVAADILDRNLPKFRVENCDDGASE